ncbi:MAG: hypothetical protein WDA59_07320 [Methanofastidiosum sp.]
MLNYQVRPQDLTTLTEEQIKQDIEYLAKNKSLRKLRKDHFVINQLLEIAHTLQNEFVIRNLEVKRQIYTCAVSLREFGEY